MIKIKHGGSHFNIRTFYHHGDSKRPSAPYQCPNALENERTH